MPTEETRLKSPNTKILAKLIKQIDQQIDDGADVQFTEPDAVDCVDALRWILQFLDNRKLYHKKRQFQGKMERQLLEEALRGKGIDVAALKLRATQIEADQLIDASIDEDELPEKPERS